MSFDKYSIFMPQSFTKVGAKLVNQRGLHFDLRLIEPGSAQFWVFWLIDPLNDHQKLCNLFYLKANFLSLMGVKVAVKT